MNKILAFIVSGLTYVVFMIGLGATCKMTVDLFNLGWNIQSWLN